MHFPIWQLWHSFTTYVNFRHRILRLSPRPLSIPVFIFCTEKWQKRSKCLYACFLCISAYKLNYYMLCYSSRCFWCTLKDFLIMSSTSIHLFLKTFLQPRDHMCTFGGFRRDVPSGLPGWYWGYVGSGQCRFIGVLAGEWGRGSLLVCILVRYPARGWRGGDRYILVIGY